MPNAAVIVAHPDDETLWCGGMIMNHPDWDWFALTICRGDDSDRAERFHRALHYFGAQGGMASLDDGVDQRPLADDDVQRAILEGLPQLTYDQVFTHGPNGEYTRHRRHEECCRGVTALWRSGHIRTSRLSFFAYEDANGTTLPQARSDADQRLVLDPQTLARKRHVVTQLYGFDADSWEASTTPAIEGFFCAESPQQADQFVQRERKQRPSAPGLRR